MKQTSEEQEVQHISFFVSSFVFSFLACFLPPFLPSPLPFLLLSFFKDYLKGEVIRKNFDQLVQLLKWLQQKKLVVLNQEPVSLSQSSACVAETLGLDY